ncbi:transposase [Actinoplanes nipponensis]|uniref:transposase n=1 Tax=Actinoplanes nipponensis TaxID=135950 RepID=UPI001EF31B20|nr:transposase [Actinoplanes nipponensis]
MVASLATAVRAGVLTADAVALEARKFAESGEQRPADGPTMRHPAGNEVSLTERRLAQLPPDWRPLLTVSAYDQVLRYRRTVEGTGS